MKDFNTLALSHPLFLEHDLEEHFENKDRLKEILKEIENSDLKPLLDLSIERFATKQDISLAHDESYFDYVMSLQGKDSFIDYETYLSKNSVQAALLAAGLGIELIERIIEKKIKNGFALLRPPGHHARQSTGMGFCIFNNIAIAAKKALSLGLKRILILDFDVHHGNGTQEIFYNDDRVLFIDFHQNDLFPLHSGSLLEKGQEKGKNFTVNLPLSAGCQDQDYLYLFDHLIEPIAHEFQPELILVSAGFDAHESDPLGFMKLTTNGYNLLTKRIKRLANKLCEGKLLFFLEGGYNPVFLARNVITCLKELSLDSKEIEEKEDFPITPQVKDIYEHHKNIRFNS